MSVFSKIISGDVKCYKIAEDEHHLAFLDINPLKKGHTLVIPKIEVDNIFDLDDSAFAHLHLFAKGVANAMKKAITCKKIGVAIIGLEVPHAHIHLIPIDNVAEINFTQPKLALLAPDMEAIASQIREYYTA